MCRVGKIFQGDLLGTSESCDSPHYLISPSQQLPNPRGRGGPDLQGPGAAGDAVGTRAERDKVAARDILNKKGWMRKGKLDV